MCIGAGHRPRESPTSWFESLRTNGKTSHLLINRTVDPWVKKARASRPKIRRESHYSWDIVVVRMFLLEELLLQLVLVKWCMHVQRNLGHLLLPLWFLRSIVKDSCEFLGYCLVVNAHRYFSFKLSWVFEERLLDPKVRKPLYLLCNLWGEHLD